MNKVNERIRTLESQLAAKERELADQKWVFEQFMQSPSWRLTYPIRWLAKQLRALKALLSGEPETASGEASLAGLTAGIVTEDSAGDAASMEWKDLFTSFQSLQLQTLLASEARIRVPRDENPEISILLVTFNRAELTLACLRSIQQNYFQRLEVIIVDNASSDSTAQLLDRIDGAGIIRNAENLHFNEGVRQAAREARGENLLIFNNDAQLMPGALEAALSTLRSDPGIGAVGARIILLDGTLQEAGSIVWRDGSCLGYGRGDDPFAPMYMFRRDVDYCSGAFVLTPRAVWERLGGFDERYKPMYYEETDYCARLWEAGLRVVYEPQAAILHFEFASAASTGRAIELQRSHQQVFAARHPAFLANRHPASADSILPARMHDSSRKRVLFLEDRIPHTWLGSGFPRAKTILRALQKHGCFITCYPLSIFDEDWNSAYSDQSPDIEFMLGYGPQMLEAFLRNRQGYYSTILVSRPHNMKIFKSILSDHPEWFENVNVIYDAEALFVSREITLHELSGQRLPAAEIERMTKEEVDLAAVSDLVVSVSEYERRTFRRHGVERCEVLGHALQICPTPRPFDERTGFLFVGAIYEENSPNGDSLIWFLTEILPRIRQALGDVPFTIAGLNRSERIREMATGSVRLLGFMRDLADLYDSARVFVAPTRYAAGIPHKVHEAAARGVPVVATPLLAEQLGWNDGAELLAGVDAESFARKCIQLHEDRGVWTRVRESALSRIDSECSQAQFDARLKEIIAAPRMRFADAGMDR